MNRSPGTTRRSDSRGGHSLLELMIAIGMIPLLLAAAFEVLASANRFHARHLAAVEAREVARVAVEVLSSELRAASPAWGGLYAIAADSLALRSIQAVGFVCSTSDSSLSLWRSSGVFAASPLDSALLFMEGDPLDPADDTAVAAQIAAVAPGGGLDCPGSHPAEHRLTLTSPAAGLAVGAPVLAFRPYVYRLYRGGDGRWWFGQRLRGGVIQPIAGPFAPPAEGGLRFEYRTAVGGNAARPEDVVQVSIAVRSRVPRRGRASDPYVSDSLTILVTPRNR